MVGVSVSVLGPWYWCRGDEGGCARPNLGRLNGWSKGRASSPIVHKMHHKMESPPSYKFANILRDPSSGRGQVNLNLLAVPVGISGQLIGKPEGSSAKLEGDSVTTFDVAVGSSKCQ